MKNPVKSPLPDSLLDCGCAEWTVDNQQVLCESQDMGTLFGFDPNDSGPSNHIQLYGPYDQWRLQRVVKQCLEKKSISDHESAESGQFFSTLIIPVRSANSPVTLVEEYVSPQWDDNGNLVGCLCKVVDISARRFQRTDLLNAETETTGKPANKKLAQTGPERRLHPISHHSFVPNSHAKITDSGITGPSQVSGSPGAASHEEMAEILDQLNEGVCAADSAGFSYFSNPAFESFSDILENTDKEQRSELFARLSRLERLTQLSGVTQYDEIKITNAGNVHCYLVQKTPNNTRGGITTTIRQVAAQDSARDYRHFCSQDPLTGLLDRDGLLRALAPYYDLAPIDDQPTCTIICVRLDTSVVDHPEADLNMQSQLMCMTAACIETTVRPGDVCGRWSDNEFIIGIRHISRANAEIVATRLTNALTSINFVLNGSSLQSFVHHGIALKSSKINSLGELIAASQFQSKSLGRSIQALSTWPSGVPANRTIN